jgi:hypothetical protein
VKASLPVPRIISYTRISVARLKEFSDAAFHEIYAKPRETAQFRESCPVITVVRIAASFRNESDCPIGLHLGKDAKEKKTAKSEGSHAETRRRGVKQWGCIYPRLRGYLLEDECDGAGEIGYREGDGGGAENSGDLGW